MAIVHLQTSIRHFCQHVCITNCHPDETFRWIYIFHWVRAPLGTYTCSTPKISSALNKLRCLGCKWDSKHQEFGELRGIWVTNSVGVLRKCSFARSTQPEQRARQQGWCFTSCRGLWGELEKSLYFYMPLFPHLQNEALVPHPGHWRSLRSRPENIR